MLGQSAPVPLSFCMRAVQIVIVVLLAVLIGIPVAARISTRATAPARTTTDIPTLVVVTPHVEQIRFEFARAFSDWHARHHGTPVRIDWRSPGGTTEIRKQLESQLQAAVAAGHFSLRPPSTLKAPDRDKKQLPEAVIDANKADLPDIIFGGGSFEHTALKAGIITEVLNPQTGQRERVRVRLTSPPTPAPFAQDNLDENYGENVIGIEKLYDPDQYWFGAALSGFGIVYNRDQLRRLGLPEPTGFADMGHPKLLGRVAMSDARQSGSVATLYDSILNAQGWDRGWRTLRDMSANARYFTASSTQPPQDVSQGECVMGVAIDFYGRGQSQAVLAKGQDPATGRVGYIDPPGATYIDADPASIVNGAPNAEIAKRFMEFLMTDEAQALWQFAPTGPPQKGATEASRPLGPQEYALRRMPAKRGMYTHHLAQFTDKTNPFEIASKTPLRGWRDLIGPLMGAFAVDVRADLRPAWEALIAARARVASNDPTFSPETLARMEALFYAMPTQTITNKDGTTETLTLSEQTYKRISEATGRWRDPEAGAAAKIAYTRFFQNNYRQVVRLYEEAEQPAAKQ